MTAGEPPLVLTDCNNPQISTGIVNQSPALTPSSPLDADQSISRSSPIVHNSTRENTSGAHLTEQQASAQRPAHTSPRIPPIVNQSPASTPLTPLDAGQLVAQSSPIVCNSTWENTPGTHLMEHQASAQRPAHTSLQIPTMVNQLPASTPSPLDVGQLVARSSPILSSQPALHVPVVPLTINTQVNSTSNGLTHEQIEFLKALWSAGTLPTEIAQVMQWMREGRDTGSRRLVGADCYDTGKIYL